jgi:SAM-dependent methyltransferase
VKRFALVFVVSLVSLVLIADERGHRIQYGDVPGELRHHWPTEGSFAAYLRNVEADTDRRVAEGEREHLIHYALQSSAFTARPRIEPARSGGRFAEQLSSAERERLVRDPSYLPSTGWPADERARMIDFLGALAKESADPRLISFKQLLHAHGPATLEALYPDYVRVARFLYQKEFLSAGASPADVAQVARLYQSRAHSSDTQTEAGFGVFLGLGTIRALDSSRRIRSVVVIGPGLDLAPRTDLVDAVAPQSYQPFAVADALLALSLSSERDLRIRSVDVNPRVVRFLQAAAREPVTLHLFNGVDETAASGWSADYRMYLNELGRAIGDEVAPPRALASEGRYQRSILVRRSVREAMTADRINIITERPVAGAGVDLIVATNVLSYFDDRQVALTLSNIAALLRPGGYLLHNESRKDLAELAGAIGLPVLHMRTAVLGGPAARPLYDSVWLHQKTTTPR